MRQSRSSNFSPFSHHPTGASKNCSADRFALLSLSALGRRWKAQLIADFLRPTPSRTYEQICHSYQQRWTPSNRLGGGVSDSAADETLADQPAIHLALRSEEGNLLQRSHKMSGSIKSSQIGQVSLQSLQLPLSLPPCRCGSIASWLSE